MVIIHAFKMTQHRMLGKYFFLLYLLLPGLPTHVSAEEGDWSTEWSSWSRKRLQVVTRRPTVIVKERLKGESVVFDIKKAEVGVRYRVVEDDYGIRQLIPIDVPVYREQEDFDFDGVDVSGIDPGLKVLTRFKKRTRPSPKFKSCHRYWQRGLKRFGDVECLDEEKGKKKLGNPRRRKVTKNSTTAPTRREPAGATTTTAAATNRTRTGQHEICKVFQTSRFC